MEKSDYPPATTSTALESKNITVGDSFSFRVVASNVGGLVGAEFCMFRLNRDTESLGLLLREKKAKC